MNRMEQIKVHVTRNDIAPKSFEKKGPEHVSYDIEQIRGAAAISFETVPTQGMSRGTIKTFLVGDRVTQAELKELCYSHDITVSAPRVVR